jgi:FkbM family methyltransferase
MKATAFDTPCAQRAVEARWAPLRELLPDLLKQLRLETALDAGCGVGYFSNLLGRNGLRVVGFDGRRENAEEAHRRLPGLKFFTADVEDASTLELGCFDLVLCFGLLYHLENPFRAIRNLSGLTEKVLLIESMCAPSRRLDMCLLNEPSVEDQSLTTVAFYPSEPCLIRMCYEAGFPWVYRVTNLPKHEDFRTSLWQKARRSMLAASKLPLTSRFLDLVPRPSADANIWATRLSRLRNVPSWTTSSIRTLLRCSLALLSEDELAALARLVAASPSFEPCAGWTLGVGESHSGLLLRLRRRLWFQAKSPFVIKWLDGARIWAYPTDEILRSIFVTGRFEPAPFSFLNRVLASGMTFVDAGANLGLYSLFAAKRVGESGTVLAIEPSSREFHRLQTNIELNTLTNVRLFRTGLWNSSSEMELLVAAENRAGHNTLGAFGYDTALCGKEKIFVEPLDNIVQREKLRRVDVIKMDIEGAELFALQGALATLSAFRPILLLELSDRTLRHQGCNAREVWEFLVSKGYRILLYDDHLRRHVPGERKAYFDGENVVAIHETTARSVVL